MTLISDRNLGLSLGVVALITVAAFFLMGLFMVELLVGMGLMLWVVWHISGPRVARLIARRDVKRRDVKLISSISHEPERFGLRGVLRLSFYPNLFAFSLLSLAYQILGVEVGSPSELINFMVYAFFILPLTIFIPAIWVIENSGIVVVRPDEYPRGLAYLEIVGDFIDIGSLIGLALTVGLALRASESLLDAFTWVIAFLVVSFIVMLIPSLLATSLYLRLSLLRAVQAFRERITLYDVDVDIEYRCPSCGAPITLGERYCPECGRAVVE